MTARRPVRPDRAGGGRPPGGGASELVALASVRRRVRALMVMTLFVFSLFAAQLLRLQGGFADRTQATRQAQDMLTRKKTLPATRGRILDRDGVELATSTKGYDLAISQRAIVEYKKLNPQTRKKETVGAAGAAADLAPLLNTTAGTLEPLLTPPGGDASKGRWYVPIATKIDPATWRKIRALDIPGVFEDEVSMRAYPAQASTAALLGWVGATGNATGSDGGGLELQYNSILQGTPGQMTREYSLDNRVIPMGDSDVSPAIPGRDVRLSIVRDLQWYAYNTLAAQVREFEATWGSVVVMDRRGRVLAMAQYPTFDPAATRSGKDLTRNLALQDAVEPGSTAKVMSIGAALAEQKVTPTQVFSVADTIRPTGSDKTFKDSHSHKPQRMTVAGILAESSNTGTIQVAEKVSASRLEAYYRAFGTGELSGIDWTGQTRGLFAPAKDWSTSQRYTVIFGQGMAMSPIQAAGVFQAIANDGVRIPPTLVEGWMEPNGTFTRRAEPQSVQVVSADVAKQLKRIMESVVSERGTAVKAEIPGYRVAGKTGTAYVYSKGRQSGYTASFIGMAPAEDPQFIVSVMLQQPKHGYYGGVAAAPVFKRVMSFALDTAGVRPSSEPATPYPLREGEDASTRRPATGTPTGTGSRTGRGTASTTKTETATRPTHTPTRATRAQLTHSDRSVGDPPAGTR